MRDVYITAYCRTPIGKMGGALRPLTVADLSAAVFEEIVKRGGISKDMVDEIVMGETRPSSAIHNVARHAALLSGFPYEVVGYTIQQACSSGMCSVQNSVNKNVIVELKGKREYRGVLDGYDPHMNVVLKNAEERVDGNPVRKLSTVIVRGDNVIYISP